MKIYTFAASYITIGRYYFKNSEEVLLDIKHDGNIRGAITKAINYANAQNAIVYIILNGKKIKTVYPAEKINFGCVGAGDLMCDDVNDPDIIGLGGHCIGIDCLRFNIKNHI